MSKVNLEGRVALITGAAGNIGAATAMLLAERGAKIVAVDVLGADFSKLASDLPASAQAIMIEADVRSEESVANYVRAAVTEHGRIDIFFNNAGVLGPVAPTEDYDLDTLRFVFDVNVYGVFLGMKHVLPVMYAQGRGSIINTSSIVGLVGFANMIGYTASKHAVLGLTRAAGIEAASRGVRVNCVCPGPIDGRMMASIDGGHGPEAEAERAAFVPAKRYGQPGEVAAIVAFLASDESSFCNGAFYSVDGGLAAV